MMIRELIDKLNYYTELYDNGTPEISDKEWDTLYFQLLNLEKETGEVYPDSPTQKINYTVVSQLNKVDHNHWMGSLAKTKDWDEFLNLFDPGKDVIGMLKLDGLSCSLRYLNGKLVSAETRGDGYTGEDILHNALVIKSIPNRINYTEELIVDGEIICTYKDFKEFQNNYKNPRNFAAGSIRLLDAGECAKRNLTFVAWHAVKGLSNSVLSNFVSLNKLGFTTTPYTSSFDWDAKDFLKKKAEEYGYPIDGLVGRYDDIEYGESLGKTGHHPKSAYAFKFYDEEYETKLLSIEYEPSRNGQLTPVAVFESVDFDGSTVERASLSNISVLWDTLGIFPFTGEILYITKRNSIIPKIERAEQKIDMSTDLIVVPNICPVCGGEARIKTSDTGVKTLWCLNPKCGGKLVNILDHYCGKTGMDIKGLSSATLQKLIDWGWVKNITDLYSLFNKKKEWSEKPGFGVRSVEKILNAIEASKEASLDKFISAIGIPEVGPKAAKILADKFETYTAFREASTFDDIEGFGEIMNSKIKQFNYKEADELAKLFNFKKVVKANNNKFDGLVFVITGSLKEYKNRKELQTYIENNGGKVSGSISKNTNYLINNDINSSSSKNISAKKLGVKIITEKEFNNLT